MSNAVISIPRSRSVLALTGAGSILVAGLIHLVLTPEHLEEATYLGLLFVADFAGAAAAAFGTYRGHLWGWILGALVAGGAFVLYVISGMVGLPGVEGEHLLEPVGIVTKTAEALFLVLCAFAFTGTGRRVFSGGVVAVSLALVGLMAVFGSSGATMAHGHGASAGGGGGGGGGQAGAGLPVRWKATSPAVHLGDRYTVVVKNTGEEEQQTRVTAEIMDHSTQTNTTVIDELPKLAPGEEREFEAVNDYGTADHFVTRARSATEDISLGVRITDEAGEEIVRFSEKAFLVWEGPRNTGE